MNVAIISDIHANIFGLRAVLGDLSKVEKILCAGDITGYYPFVNEVIEELKENNVTSVKGNHDEYLIQGHAPYDATDIIKDSVKKMKDLISKENFEFIKALPGSLNITIDNKKIMMFHGSPWDYLNERIYPDYQNFARFSELETDVVILGHTHYPFIKKIEELTVVNPGSCGQPRDYNLLSYTIWNTKDNTFVNRRIDWNIEEFIKEASSLGTDKKLFETFDRSKK